MNFRYAVTAILCGALASMTLAAPTSALNLQFESQSAKKASGPYKGFSRGAVPDGKAKIFFFRANNNSPENFDMLLDDNSSIGAAGGFRITWFKGKKQRKDITNKVESQGGYEYRLKANRLRYFNVRVKNVADPGQGFCVSARNTGGSTIDSAFLGLNGNDCSG